MQNSTDTSETRGIPETYQMGWLQKLDGRLALAREMRDRFDVLTDDLGGADSLSYAQRSLCERALWLEFWLASQERELAQGEPFEVNKWIQGTNSLQGVFSKLGLQRQAKPVQSLTEYLQEAAE